VCVRCGEEATSATSVWGRRVGFYSGMSYRWGWALNRGVVYFYLGQRSPHHLLLFLFLTVFASSGPGLGGGAAKRAAGWLTIRIRQRSGCAVWTMGRRLYGRSLRIGGGVLAGRGCTSIRYIPLTCTSM